MNVRLASSIYHYIVVAVNHDWTTTSQVDIFFPPVTDLKHTHNDAKSG